MSDKFFHNPFSPHGGLIETIEHRSDREAADMAREIFSHLNWTIPGQKQFYSKTEADFVFLTDHGLVLSFRHRYPAAMSSDKYFQNARVNRDALILAPFVQAPIGENCLFEISPALRTSVNFPDLDELDDLLEQRALTFWDKQTDNAGYINIPDTDILLPLVLDLGSVRRWETYEGKPPLSPHDRTFKGHSVEQVQSKFFADFHDGAAQCWQSNNPIPYSQSALREFFEFARMNASLPDDHRQKRLFSSWTRPSPFNGVQTGVSRVAQNYAPMVVHA